LKSGWFDLAINCHAKRYSTRAADSRGPSVPPHLNQEAAAGLPLFHFHFVSGRQLLGACDNGQRDLVWIASQLVIVIENT